MTDKTARDLSKQDLRGAAFALKACIFATGLAGIVAEYVMATLASYLLGNAVFQWTITVSLMLFAMGVGSRISKFVEKNLLEYFVIIEFTLSLLCAGSAMVTYLLSAWTQNIAVIIYLMAMAIGLLIGLEIPIATRLNDHFEELRVNISSIMEKDYFGALAGGLLFAFVALPYLGLTYTPIILGSVNFLVAAILYLRFARRMKFRRSLRGGFIAVPVLLIALFFLARPVILYGEQSKYQDRVIWFEQSQYQRIVVTQWKDYYWLYLDGNEQFSSYDEEKYHEPLVHPAMLAAARRENILILGGGDGLAARELFKYPEVKKVTLVDLDPAVVKLARSMPEIRRLNQGSLDDPRLQVINRDAYLYLQESSEIFDVVIIDLPDPKTVSLARLYTGEFYRTVTRHLATGGVMVTQATSPFFSRRAYLSILKSMRAADMKAEAYHNHVPTLGEWGWVIGMKTGRDSGFDLRAYLLQQDPSIVETRFLNRDAYDAMFRFGKDMFRDFDEIRANDEMELSTYHYYREGDWEFY